jgi:hypothetical protein
MSLTQDLYQNFGTAGDSEKFNLHVDSTRIGWALFPKAENPNTKSILLSEARNIMVNKKAFNTANLVAGGAIVSVSTQGRIKLNIETLVGGSFANDTILVYLFNNSGVLEFRVKKVSLSQFTSGDPNSYGSDTHYPICEITTTV